ncbi:MAG: hypothetical protein KDE34_13530, partial [Anaerolineales bacterium]|nr:hypothetical protein [Anaerolineales bacterium]
MNLQQAYLAEYFHTRFTDDMADGLAEWLAAFDRFRSGWLIEDCQWLLKEVRRQPLNAAGRA